MKHLSPLSDYFPLCYQKKTCIFFFSKKCMGTCICLFIDFDFVVIWFCFYESGAKSFQKKIYSLMKGFFSVVRFFKTWTHRESSHRVSNGIPEQPVSSHQLTIILQIAKQINVDWACFRISLSRYCQSIKCLCIACEISCIDCKTG